jgi:hypothetical protein
MSRWPLALLTWIVGELVLFVVLVDDPPRHFLVVFVLALSWTALIGGLLLRGRLGNAAIPLVVLVLAGAWAISMVELYGLRDLDLSAPTTASEAIAAVKETRVSVESGTMTIDELTQRCSDTLSMPQGGWAAMAIRPDHDYKTRWQVDWSSPAKNGVSIELQFGVTRFGDPFPYSSTEQKIDEMMLALNLR